MRPQKTLPASSRISREHGEVSATGYSWAASADPRI